MGSSRNVLFCRMASTSRWNSGDECLTEDPRRILSVQNAEKQMRILGSEEKLPDLKDNKSGGFLYKCNFS